MCALPIARSFTKSRQRPKEPQARNSAGSLRCERRDGAGPSLLVLRVPCWTCLTIIGAAECQAVGLNCLHSSRYMRLKSPSRCKSAAILHSSFWKDLLCISCLKAFAASPSCGNLLRTLNIAFVACPRYARLLLNAYPTQGFPVCSRALNCACRGKSPATTGVVTVSSS